MGRLKALHSVMDCNTFSSNCFIKGPDIPAALFLPEGEPEYYLDRELNYWDDAWVKGLAKRFDEEHEIYDYSDEYLDYGRWLQYDVIAAALGDIMDAKTQKRLADFAGMPGKKVILGPVIPRYDRTLKACEILKHMVEEGEDSGILFAKEPGEIGAGFWEHLRRSREYGCGDPEIELAVHRRENSRDHLLYTANLSGKEKTAFISVSDEPNEHISHLATAARFEITAADGGGVECQCGKAPLFSAAGACENKHGEKRHNCTDPRLYCGYFVCGGECMIDSGLKVEYLDPELWTHLGEILQPLSGQGQVLHVRRLSSGLYRAVKCSRGTAAVCESEAGCPFLDLSQYMEGEELNTERIFRDFYDIMEIRIYTLEGLRQCYAESQKAELYRLDIDEAISKIYGIFGHTAGMTAVRRKETGERWYFESLRRLLGDKDGDHVYLLWITDNRTLYFNCILEMKRGRLVGISTSDRYGGERDYDKIQGLIEKEYRMKPEVFCMELSEYRTNERIFWF